MCVVCVVVEDQKGATPIYFYFKGSWVTLLISTKNFFVKVVRECLTGGFGFGIMGVQGVWKAGFLRD